MNDRALIYGTIAIDTLITPKGEAHSVLGGSGPYAAMAARMFTEKVDLVGVVGDDFPSAWKRTLETRGVSMQHVAHKRGQTFAWTGKYEKDMNRRTTVSRVEGVQERWKVNLSPELRACSLAVATNVTPRLQCRMLEQCPHARFRMADSMKGWLQRQPADTRKLLRMVDLMLLNDEEAQFWTKTDDSIEAGFRLLEQGPRFVIVKHGSTGSTLFHRSPEGDTHMFRCPAWPLIHPQDPTGAGDAYMGALAGMLAGLMEIGNPTWEDMKRSIAVATVVAAAACEDFGTASLCTLTRDELARRITAFHQMTRWG